MEQTVKGECTHENIHDRAMIGTWVTAELQVAVNDHGYKVLEFYQAWHYPQTTQYSKETMSGGIWAEYINTWLKIKQESDGYPAYVKTEADKDAYIADYASREGIILDKNKIVKNQGLRSVAKSLLCIIWGKFGQRDRMPQTTYVSDPAEYISFMTDSEKTVNDVQMVNEEHVAIRWTCNKGFEDPLPNTNVVLAATTTALARLRLHKIMHRLGRRVLYVDTDSVIWIDREHQWHPESNVYLGGLKDELDGDYIKEFVSAGPKNYAYVTESGENVCKVKGFTLDVGTSKLLNIDSMKLVVTDKNAEETITTSIPFKIVRKKCGIYSVSAVKKYRLVYDKRWIGQKYITYPYGWKPS